MSLRNLVAIVSVGLTLTACADLFTVHQVTEIPNKKDPSTLLPARAIHLDAQQRLVIATAQGYCAEPSPDALASYAAALGFDLDPFGQNPVSVAQALKSDAGSIGLRTQSITLMRDALYRMCEASNNGYLHDTEVVAFLRRSQDLTAVVLAIEQLTGAVAANQVILTPSAKADALANLVSNHQLLDQMEKDVKEKEKDVEKKEKIVEEKKKATNDAQLELDNAINSEKEQAKKSLFQAKNIFKTAAEDFKVAQKRLQDTKELRDRIKEFRDEAIENTTTETAGTGQFSPIVQRNQLSGRATEAVAGAVYKMVKEVLKKSYMPDVCLSYLTSSEGTRQKIQEQIEKNLRLKQERSEKITRRSQEQTDSEKNKKKEKLRLTFLANQEQIKQEEATLAIQALKDPAISDPGISDPGIQQIYIKQKKVEAIASLCKDIILKSLTKKQDNESKANEGPSK